MTCLSTKKNISTSTGNCSSSFISKNNVEITSCISTVICTKCTSTYYNVTTTCRKASSSLVTEHYIITSSGVILGSIVSHEDVTESRRSTCCICCNTTSNHDTSIRICVVSNCASDYYSTIST